MRFYQRDAMSDFEAFYRANVRLIYALARARNAAEAEDLTQETFLRAWQHFGRLSRAEPPAQRAWLVRTLRNLATDVWRRQRADAVWREPLPEPESDRADLRADLQHALKTLDGHDREIVTMRYLEEMNSREIGEALGLPEGTVRRRLAECRGVLAQHLSQWAPKGETP